MEFVWSSCLKIRGDIENHAGKIFNHHHIFEIIHRKLENYVMIINIETETNLVKHTNRQIPFANSTPIVENIASFGQKLTNCRANIEFITFESRVWSFALWEEVFEKSVEWSNSFWDVGFWMGFWVWVANAILGISLYGVVPDVKIICLFLIRQIWQFYWIFQDFKVVEKS